MKKSLPLFLLFSILSCHKILAQVIQKSNFCATPNLDSATAVSLPYYGNNQLLENYLNQNGYNNLESISFSSPMARTMATSFLEPKFLVPLNLHIYRNRANDPASSISEDEAREYIWSVNEIYRNAGTAIQFYINRVEVIANDFYHTQISTTSHVYDLWSSQRLANDSNKGLNVHFIKNNRPPEDGGGKASLPHYPLPPFTAYSLLIRTHRNDNSNKQLNKVIIVGTLTHEIGHALGLLHTHHPGRLASLASNNQNGTISNDCFQESVSRTRTNKKKEGCFSTRKKRKCEINGDFLCDTDADPKQSAKAKDCNYVYPASGDFKVDNWNEVWTPPINNIMSYTNDACRTEFSRGQIAIMWMQLSHFQEYIEYQAPSITEASTICNDSAKDMILSNYPAKASISWEAKPASLLKIAQGVGSTAQILAANPLSQGSVTITFSITGPGNCYVATVDKSVQIGALSSSQIKVLGQHKVSGGSQYTYTATPYSPAFSYSWKYPNNWTKVSQSGNQVTLYTPQNATPDGGVLAVSITNGCGASPYSGITVYPANSSSSYSYAAYPNPVNEALTIEQIAVQHSGLASGHKRLKIASLETSVQQEEFRVKLYDKNKKEVSSGKSNKSKAVIDTRKLPKGIYYLNIYYKEEVIQQQVIIEK